MAVIADVFDMIAIDAEGNVIATTTLTESGIEVSVQENDVRAGKGNQLLGVLHSDRDITVNATDVSFRYDWLAKQLGQNIVTGAGVAYAMPKWYTVELDDMDKVIELDEEPNDDNSIALYDANGVKLALTTDFTVSGKTITITKSGINVGDAVEVRTYTYDTSAQTQTINIDNAVFGKGMKIILETYEIDEETETVTHKLQWQFDKALPSGNFTINTQSAREAVTHAFSFRIVKPKSSTKVGHSIRIPVGA